MSFHATRIARTGVTAVTSHDPTTTNARHGNRGGRALAIYGYLPNQRPKGTSAWQRIQSQTRCDPADARKPKRSAVPFEESDSRSLRSPARLCRRSSGNFERPLFQGNLGVVDAGKVIRSAQPTSQLPRWVDDFHLKSILNLRGGDSGGLVVRSGSADGRARAAWRFMTCRSAQPGARRGSTLALDRHPRAVSVPLLDPLQIGSRPNRPGFGALPHAQARRTARAGRTSVFHRVWPHSAWRHRASARAVARIRRLAQGQRADPHAGTVSRLGQERLPVSPIRRPIRLPTRQARGPGDERSRANTANIASESSETLRVPRPSRP